MFKISAHTMSTPSLSLEEAINLINQGKITDVKTIIGILWLDRFLS